MASIEPSGSSRSLVFCVRAKLNNGRVTEKKRLVNAKPFAFNVSPLIESVFAVGSLLPSNRLRRGHVIRPFTFLW